MPIASHEKLSALLSNLAAHRYTPELATRIITQITKDIYAAICHQYPEIAALIAAEQEQAEISGQLRLITESIQARRRKAEDFTNRSIKLAKSGDQQGANDYQAAAKKLSASTDALSSRLSTYIRLKQGMILKLIERKSLLTKEADNIHATYTPHYDFLNTFEQTPGFPYVDVKPVMILTTTTANLLYLYLITSHLSPQKT